MTRDAGRLPSTTLTSWTIGGALGPALDVDGTDAVGDGPGTVDATGAAHATSDPTSDATTAIPPLPTTTPRR
jgi:hypothetical protein